MKIVSCLILTLLAAQPARAQQTTREDFKEFCQAMAGRWVGEVTWVADWPGLGKRGEKATAYMENSISEDGHVLLVRWLGGPGSGTETIIYDASAKQLRASGGDSGGTTWLAFLSKKGGKWEITATGSLADGTKFEGRRTLTISDQNNRLHYVGPTTIPGQKTDELNLVWRRAGK